VSTNATVAITRKRATPVNTDARTMKAFTEAGRVAASAMSRDIPQRSFAAGDEVSGSTAVFTADFRCVSGLSASGLTAVFVTADDLLLSLVGISNDVQRADARHKGERSLEYHILFASTTMYFFPSTR
jgi:hypothetical protein